MLVLNFQVVKLSLCDDEQRPPPSPPMAAVKRLQINYKSLHSIAKDCLLTLVKSRLALGSPGWLVVTMPKMGEYTQFLLTPPSIAQCTSLQSTTANHSPVQLSTDQYSPVS